MQRPKIRYLFLLFSLAMMLTGVFLSSVTQNSMGAVIVTEVDILDSNGLTVHATLQQPSYATSSSPLPAVVVYHGSLQNKEWLMAFGIELARRGFVVLTPDADGHGNSDEGADSGSAALDYVASLDYVDSTSIGLIGHSMGGSTVWRAINTSDVGAKAVILVGSWVRPEWNATYPQNLLVTVGDFDSLSSIPRNYTSLEKTFNSTSIEEYVTYGSFVDGTARKLVVARTNHLFETVDPEIIGASVEWMKSSLKGGIEDANWISTGNIVYQWWLIGGFLSTLGLVFTIFPLLSILLRLPQLSLLKEHPPTPQNNEIDGRKWRLFYSLLPAITFYPLLLVGALVPFPQSYGVAISLWFLGTAMVLYTVFKYGLKRDIRGESSTRLKGSKKSLMSTFVLAILVILWLYAWTLFADLGFALDFRCFLPGMNDLTLSRALFVPIYAIVLLVYFVLDGIWLVGVHPQPDVQPWYKGQVLWSFQGILTKCLPFIVLIAIEFGAGMLFGYPVIPGLIGYTFLFFYAFTPWFAVSVVITTWSYRSTGRFFLGALINALIFAWMIATILAF